MKSVRRMLLGGGTAMALLVGAGMADARANPSMLQTFKFDQPTFIKPHPSAIAHIVLEVSENDPARWNLALHVVHGVLTAMGDSKVQIVVVAYGPGVRMLFVNSPVSSRVAKLDSEGVEFDACHNTMEHMAKRLGHLPALVPQAVIVPAGVVRIVQLEEHGFNPIKP